MVVNVRGVLGQKKKILGQSGTNALGKFVHLIPKR